MPAAGLRPAPDVANPADVVVRNARIYTGDRPQPTASAVAISGGVLTAVSDDAAVAGHVGANTRIVDWLGRPDWSEGFRAPLLIFGSQPGSQWSCGFPARATRTAWPWL